MSKFNTATAAPVGAGPVTTSDTADGATYEGAPGYTRDAKSELFLLAVSNMVSERTFYESAAERDSRFRALIEQVCEDANWLHRFVLWLRNDANMRTASLVLALEAVHARLARNIHGGNRLLVSVSMSRADEPGEALAYWTGRYGRHIPKPVKRGIADAATRLYTEKALLKYDTPSHGFRFGDVIDLVHPTPSALWQSDLFRYALDRRHGHDEQIPETLSMLHARAEWKAAPNKRDLFGTDLAERAGVTWEALSGDIDGGMDAAAWEAVIPQMGYMALLRNLRNFLEAGVAEQVLDAVAARLADPEQVAKSRQLPLRFLSAYRATADSTRFAHPIEQALNHSISGVPVLPGTSLILVDRSNSMFWDTLSARSQVTRADAAALFGTALALRADHAVLVQYGHQSTTGADSQQVHYRTGDSVLPIVERKFVNMNGTNTEGAVQQWFAGHDRVIILTDEQAGYYGHMSRYGEPRGAVEVGSVLPPHVPLYTWNLAGYPKGHAPGVPNRHTFGGLSDAGFGLIGLIERGLHANWPF